MTPEQQAAIGALATNLSYLGIDGLFTVGPDGTYSGWLVDQVQNGIDTPEELGPLIDNLPQVIARYPAYKALRDQALAGKPVQPLTYAQIREYEQQATSMARSAGFPPEVLDSPQELQDLIIRGIDLPALKTRIGEVWNRVANTTPEIRAYYSEHYGGVGQGDSWLATEFLDPDKSEVYLQKRANAAAVGGTGSRFGFGVSTARAEQLAAMGFDETNSGDAFSRVAPLRDLTHEAFGERTDLTDETLISAGFNTDGTSTTAVQDRIRNRRAAQAGGGGAAATSTGVAGLGSGR